MLISPKINFEKIAYIKNFNQPKIDISGYINEDVILKVFNFLRKDFLELFNSYYIYGGINKHHNDSKTLPLDIDVFNDKDFINIGFKSDIISKFNDLKIRIPKTLNNNNQIYINAPLKFNFNNIMFYCNVLNSFIDILFMILTKKIYNDYSIILNTNMNFYSLISLYYQYYKNDFKKNKKILKELAVEYNQLNNLEKIINEVMLGKERTKYIMKLKN